MLIKRDAKYSEGVILYSCVNDTPKPGGKCGPCMRNVYLLELCTEGYGSVVINGCEFPISPGTGYLLFPGDRVTHTADRTNPRKGYCCVLGGMSLGKFAAKMGISSTQPYIPSQAVGEVAEYMKQLVEDNSPEDPGKELRRLARVYDMLGAMLRYASKPDRDGWTERILGLIEAQYHEPITVQRLAQQLSMERSYFSVQFKEKVGTSPGNYLAAVRVEKACILLCETNEPIAEVAAAVGLDTRNFARIFKQRTGKTPRQYREQHRKEA